METLFTTNRSGVLRPDFSTAGGGIGFGIRTRLEHVNMPGPGRFDSLPGNRSINVSTAPEPSPLWLMITCFTRFALISLLISNSRVGQVSEHTNNDAGARA
jgi:hypothetical protein